MQVIIDNKKKIYSNTLHNSVDHILKSQFGSDLPVGHHPYMSSEWEQEVTDWCETNIWVGLYEILYKNTNIPNFYEFKWNLPLSESNKLGFAARSEGRKNPHYLDKIPSLIFTNSQEFNVLWKNGVKVDISKSNEVEDMIKMLVKKYGQLDGAVNNAGIEAKFGETVEETSEESFDKVMGIFKFHD